MASHSTCPQITWGSLCTATRPSAARTSRLAALGRFAEQLETPHVEHLKVSLAYGPPTWQHRHDPDLMRYLLEHANAA